MLSKIILNYLVGLLVGFILEFVYRSLCAKRFIRPLFINLQMYGLSAVFLYGLALWPLNPALKIILMAVFMTALEFIIGYGYWKIKRIRLWDYSRQPLNFKGFICPLFSAAWLALALLYYYLILPLSII